MSAEPNFFEIHLGDELENDLHALFAGLNEAAPAESPPPPPAITEKSEFPRSDSSGSALRMSELEKLLFDESEDANNNAEDAIGVGGGGGGDYSRDLFLDLLADEVECAGDAPDELMVADAQEEKEEDLVSKKRKRQMRNREAAMKSRERKNLYVKELEMKSKYMHMEIHRLDFTLRCCMAENMALRQSLHRPLGAPMARQESAVLFVESLLLGSLFWLVNTVCLFLLPVLPIQKQEDVSRLGGSSAQEAVLTRNIANERVGLGLRLVVLRRRCRGMKIKMRAMYLSSYITPVLLASG